ncbi:MAG: hypothetical protein HRU32_12030 [Rhodobacteraceae bacterium]|nr:hypothetical protein [Paracoccaceae bacterium]
MTRLVTLVVLCAGLAACGLDGPPAQPEGTLSSSPQPGITVSGDARIGVVGGF